MDGRRNCGRFVLQAVMSDTGRARERERGVDEADTFYWWGEGRGGQGRAGQGKIKTALLRLLVWVGRLFLRLGDGMRALVGSTGGASGGFL